MEGRDRAVKVAVFSAKDYDREFLAAANNSRHEFRFFDLHLNEETVGLAARFHAVCVFVNDHVDDAVVAKLAALGVRLIALRCAGYNNVDLTAAKEHAITVVRVPGYSPYAVAEHAIGLILALNRKLHRAYNRVREATLPSTACSDLIFTARPSASSAPGRLDLWWHKFSPDLAAQPWRSIPSRMNNADLAVCATSNWMNCSHNRTSSRCTVRSHRRTST